MTCTDRSEPFGYDPSALRVADCGPTYTRNDTCWGRH